MAVRTLQVSEQRVLCLPYPVEGHLADVQRLLHHSEVNCKKLSIIRPIVAFG
jgi:hypothetical protein